eukprot:UN02838
MLGELESAMKRNTSKKWALVISGDALELAMEESEFFFALLVNLSCVVCYRANPSQK